MAGTGWAGVVDGEAGLGRGWWGRIGGRPGGVAGRGLRG